MLVWASHKSVCIISGVYEPPEGRKERPTPHYSVKRHLTIVTLSLYGPQLKWCCFHNQCATLQVRVARLWLRALVMKTTLLDHLSLGPYKESVTSVQIQMPFHAVGRSFRPSGGSYAPDNILNLHTVWFLKHLSCLYLRYSLSLPMQECSGIFKEST